VLSLRSDRILKMIHQSRTDNSTEKVLRSLLTPDLLIIAGAQRPPGRDRGRELPKPSETGAEYCSAPGDRHMEVAKRKPRR